MSEQGEHLQRPCPICDGPVGPGSGKGSPPVYCSNPCRRKAKTESAKRSRARQRDRSGYEPHGHSRTLRLTPKAHAALKVPGPTVTVPLIDVPWHEEER
jgi:hypothetical protein